MQLQLNPGYRLCYLGSGYRYFTGVSPVAPCPYEPKIRSYAVSLSRTVDRCETNGFPRCCETMKPQFRNSNYTRYPLPAISPMAFLESASVRAMPWLGQTAPVPRKEDVGISELAMASDYSHRVKKARGERCAVYWSNAHLPVYNTGARVPTPRSLLPLRTADGGAAAVTDAEFATAVLNEHTAGHAVMGASPCAINYWHQLV